MGCDLKLCLGNIDFVIIIYLCPNLFYSMGEKNGKKSKKNVFLEEKRCQ